MNANVAVIAAAMMAAALGRAAHGADVCYDTAGMPSVWKLEVEGDAIRAYVENRPDEREPNAFPTVVYTQGRGWQRSDPRAGERNHTMYSAQDCGQQIAVPLTKEEAFALRPELRADAGQLEDCTTAQSDVCFDIGQEARSCTRTADAIWFGIGFYAGEGQTGVGGIGRFDLATQRQEVRRPAFLRKLSINRIAVLGDDVWIGTTTQEECTGTPPRRGLLRYSWQNGASRGYMGSGGMCGFVVQDLRVVRGSLWVASDMGVSVAEDPSAPEPHFRHYVPDLSAPSGMRETTCDALYRQLSETLSSHDASGFGSPLSWLLEGLYESGQRDRYGPAIAARMKAHPSFAPSDPTRSRFVDLAEVAPGIRREMRYAGPENFLKKAVYPCARCLLRASTAEALARVQSSLAARGLGLKVWDCYRPPAVQEAMWQLVPDPRFVADPKQGSVHSRGGAVDLTLVDAASGRELEMPTAHDDFSEKAFADAPASPAATRNRATLRAAMEAERFQGMRTEWWHFDAAGSRDWAIADVPLCAADGAEPSQP